jgi:hypothetical protein
MIDDFHDKSLSKSILRLDCKMVSGRGLVAINSRNVVYRDFDPLSQDPAIEVGSPATGSDTETINVLAPSLDLFK